MKKQLQSIGLYFPAIKDVKVKGSQYKYSKKITEKHLAYLKELSSHHQDRQSAIESKTAQLVGQSSIVFTLFALFIPLFYDKFIDFNMALKGYLIGLFAIAFTFYLFTIVHAARSLSIHKYNYATGDPNTVLQDMDSKEFITEQVKDLLYCIKKNSHIDDQKGTNLILAHRTFTIANSIFAIMAFSICIILFFERGEEKEQQNTILLKQIISSEDKLLLELKKMNYLDSINAQQSLPDTTFTK